MSYLKLLPTLFLFFLTLSSIVLLESRAETLKIAILIWFIFGIIGWGQLCVLSKAIDKYILSNKKIRNKESWNSVIKGFVFSVLLGPISIFLFCFRYYSFLVSKK
jgi:hypothetical protein